MSYNKRITPARPDLAAEHLRDEIAAPAYAPGRRMQVKASFIDLKREPSHESPTDTQALCGETLFSYEDKDGWSWVQLDKDRYVGYVVSDALTDQVVKPTHRVRVRHTFIYPEASIKAPPVDALPFGAEFAGVGAASDFIQLQTGGFVFAAHAGAAGRAMSDFVGIAETFLYTPYLWGGKTDVGLDCSGLVQVALAAVGIAAPRDSDMMQMQLGRPADVDDRLRGLKRGDLVFWRGHVAIMQNDHQVLHANAHHMMVVSEPLSLACDRIRSKGFGEVTGVRRV